VIWLILGGGVVLWLFLKWEIRVIARGGEPLIDLARIRNPVLRGGLTRSSSSTSCRAVSSSPCRCSCPSRWALCDRNGREVAAALGHAPDRRGGRSEVLPDASPRRVVQLGFFGLFVGLVVMVASLDAAREQRSRPGRCCSRASGSVHWLRSSEASPSPRFPTS